MQTLRMQNFQDTFETRNRTFIRAFSIFMTVPLKPKIYGKNGKIGGIEDDILMNLVLKFQI